MASSGNPHFFKVVLANAVKEQKLEIPKKFVREYGLKALLNDQICLKVGDGKEWNVGLTKSNDGRRIWFHHGWQNFVEFYSVKLGYFLVFKYENQSSNFYVVIFDLTGMEIEYPIKIICLDKAKEMVTMKTDIDDDLNPAFPPRGLLPLIPNQHARAMAKAIAFQSITMNPSFTCKIWASHIHPAKSLNIPKSFVEKHLEESTEAILQVSDGRMWYVHCGLYWRAKTVRKRAEFIRGWRKFAHDNALQIGDACVFEMIRKNSSKICFKVENFRA